jgi:acetolactate synthase regulatory subunit
MNAWEKMEVATAYHVELQVRKSKAIEKRALQFLSKRGYLVTKLKGVAR